MSWSTRSSWTRIVEGQRILQQALLREGGLDLDDAVSILDDELDVPRLAAGRHVHPVRQLRPQEVRHDGPADDAGILGEQVRDRADDGRAGTIQPPTASAASMPTTKRGPSRRPVAHLAAWLAAAPSLPRCPPAGCPDVGGRVTGSLRPRPGGRARRCFRHAHRARPGRCWQRPHGQGVPCATGARRPMAGRRSDPAGPAHAGLRPTGW